MDCASKVNNPHDDSAENTLPAPLVPPAYDSRKLSKLYFDRSKVYEGLGAFIWYGETDAIIQMLMAAAAWGERIPGSLPPEARSLARLVCNGDMERWLSIKDRALAGWVLCSNNRLYHHEVAEAVNTSMAQWTQRKNAGIKSGEARKAKPAKKDQKQQRNERSNARSTNAQTNVPTLAQQPFNECSNVRSTNDVPSRPVPSYTTVSSQGHDTSYQEGHNDNSSIMDDGPSGEDCRWVDMDEVGAPPEPVHRRPLGGMGSVDQALDELHGAGMDGWELAA